MEKHFFYQSMHKCNNLPKVETEIVNKLLVTELEESLQIRSW